MKSSKQNEIKNPEEEQITEFDHHFEKEIYKEILLKNTYRDDSSANFTGMNELSSNRFHLFGVAGNMTSSANFTGINELSVTDFENENMDPSMFQKVE